MTEGQNGVKTANPTRKKRANGEGSYRLRSDGRWENRFTLPDGSSRSVYGKTRQQCKTKRDAVLRDVELGLDLGGGKQLLSQFLQQWLEVVVKPARSEKTHAGYSDIVRLYIEPELGRVPLEKLKPAQVANLLQHWREEGRSPQTVHHIRAVLRTALNVAVKWRLITHNAAAQVDSPKQLPGRVKPLTAESARHALSVAASHRLSALFRLTAMMGLRQGEVLGLRWSDIDLDSRTLRVEQALQRVNGKTIFKEPKTAKSRRSLTIPGSVVQALQAHQERQEIERRLAGSRWTDSGLIFVSMVGTPLDPRNVLRIWHRILDDAKIPRVSFHGLRHTTVSLLIAEGVQLKSIQAVVGHTLISTTADIYGHLYPPAFVEAADAMDRALG